MTEQFTIQDNGDGTGTITVAGVPITPYVAPIDPPSEITPPAQDPTPTPVAKFSLTQSDNRVAVWDKSTGFPDNTKGTVDWDDGSTPGAIVAGQSGSVGHSYADGSYAITEKYSVNGVDYVCTVQVTVPKPITPSDTSPPATSEPPPDGTTIPTGPDPTATVRAFSGEELHWRDTESTDVVDITLDLDATAEQVVATGLAVAQIPGGGHRGEGL